MTMVDKEHPIPYRFFLRRIGLDETPQIYHVLKGEMAFFGPRPKTISLLNPISQEIVDTRIPGFFSLMMAIMGPGHAPELLPEHREEIDRLEVLFNRYEIEHWSVFLMAKILFLTTLTIVKQALGIAPAPLIRLRNVAKDYNLITSKQKAVSQQSPSKITGILKRAIVEKILTPAIYSRDCFPVALRSFVKAGALVLDDHNMSVEEKLSTLEVRIADRIRGAPMETGFIPTKKDILEDLHNAGLTSRDIAQINDKIKVIELSKGVYHALCIGEKAPHQRSLASLSLTDKVGAQYIHKQKDPQKQKDTDKKKDSDKKLKRRIAIWLFLLMGILFFMILMRSVKTRSVTSRCIALLVCRLNAQFVTTVQALKGVLSVLRNIPLIIERGMPMVLKKACSKFGNNKVKPIGPFYIFDLEIIYLFLYLLFFCPFILVWGFMRWVTNEVITVTVTIIKAIIKLKERQIVLNVVGLLGGNNLSEVFRIMFLTIFTLDVEFTTTTYQYKMMV